MKPKAETNPELPLIPKQAVPKKHEPPHEAAALSATGQRDYPRLSQWTEVSLKLLIYDLAIHRFRTGFNIIGLGSRQNVDYNYNVSKLGLMEGY